MQLISENRIGKLKTELYAKNFNFNIFLSPASCALIIIFIFIVMIQSNRLSKFFDFLNLIFTTISMTLFIWQYIFCSRHVCNILYCLFFATTSHFCKKQRLLPNFYGLKDLLIFFAVVIEFNKYVQRLKFLAIKFAVKIQVILF